MGLPQTIITRQMVLAELVKVGINQEIADDLSYRYYKNELTHKDIEYLKENFDIKLEKVQDSLKAEIKASHTKLDNKIDNVENNLNNKIDNVKTELKSDIEKVETSLRAEIKASHTDLDNKIDKVRTELKSEFASVNNEVALVRKDMEMNKIEINSQLVNITSKLESSSKLHYWMFGTVITLFIGVFLTLIPIAHLLLKK